MYFYVFERQKTNRRREGDTDRLPFLAYFPGAHRSQAGPDQGNKLKNSSQSPIWISRTNVLVT